MSAKFRSMLVLAAMVAIGWFAAMQTTSSGQFGSGGSSKIQQWQYHVEVSGVFDEAAASKLGGEGWEFVAIYTQSEGQFRSIYKRKS